MSSQTTILVTGASGQLGGLIVQELLNLKQSALKIIAASRTVEKLQSFAAQGVETRQLYLNDDSIIEKAFVGVDVVILISTTDIGNRAEQHARGIKAAENAGVKHLVYTSLTSARTSPGLFVDHWKTESDLSKSSLNWTILRNNLYFETLILSLRIAAQSGKIYTSAGNGQRGFISRQDIAIFTAKLVLNLEQYNHQIVDVTGAETLTIAQVAQIAASIFAREIEVVQITFEQLAQILSQFLSVPIVEGVIIPVEKATKANWMAPIADDFQNVVGREPTLFRDWLTSNRQIVEPVAQ